MNRYETYGEVIKDQQGKRRYATLYYPNMPRNERDTYFVAKKGSRLDILAHQYYGDVRLWPIIAKSNNLHEGSLFVPPGLRVRIPWIPDSFQFDDLFTEKQL